MVNSVRNIIFEHAIRTADLLVKMFGPRCEVAVHDFSNLEQSLIHLDGSVTGRKIGSPITDLVLQELNKPHHEVKDIPNYQTTSSKGNVMKSSTVFLRDDNDQIIGALCINFDLTLLIQLGMEVQDFIFFDHEITKTENFYSSVHDVVEGMVKEVIQTFNKPAGQLDMDEKIECVRKLEDRGAFLIKGSTDYLATVLNVSKYTVYNYLQKIRMQNEYEKKEEKKV
jgi:predicted transcriptional regulator YheO